MLLTSNYFRKIAMALSSATIFVVICPQIPAIGIVNAASFGSPVKRWAQHLWTLTYFYMSLSLVLHTVHIGRRGPAECEQPDIHYTVSSFLHDYYSKVDGMVPEPRLWSFTLRINQLFVCNYISVMMTSLYCIHAIETLIAFHVRWAPD